jgi:hypothetical protein
MTTIGDRLSAADRARVATRLSELRRLDSLMRKPSGNAPLPAAPPLHAIARQRATRQRRPAPARPRQEDTQ